MNAYDYITSKQQGWAKRKGLKLAGSQVLKGKKNYTEKLEDNLFEALRAQTKKELEAGDGGELRKSIKHSPKMSALHSSSALGVNIFQYWIGKDISSLLYSLGLCKKGSKQSGEIHFEQKLEIDKSFSRSPNLDILVENKKGKIKAFGIECKFSEAYTTRKHPELSDKYLKNIREQWTDIPNLFKFAKEIKSKKQCFFHLHPEQLIKHILGLKKNYGKSNFRLLYLWYDVIGPSGQKHREEIEVFSKITKQDNIKFHSISYQELISNFQNRLYKGNEKYVDYLTGRYF